MSHKDAHRPTSPHGMIGSVHRGSSVGGEHAAARGSEGESPAGRTVGDTVESNCDTLWIDIGGEG